MSFIVTSTPADPMDDRDVRDVLAQVGKHWGLLFTFGLISLILGVAIMAWPQITIGVVALLLGLWLLINGIFSLVGSFTTNDDTANRVLMGLVGAASIVLGVLCFRSFSQAVEILALFVGLGWLLQGIFTTVIGVQAKGQPGRGWTIFLGILSACAGIVVLAWPAPSLTVLAWVSGVWLVLLGIVVIIGAFRVRSVGRAAAS